MDEQTKDQKADDAKEAVIIQFPKRNVVSFKEAVSSKAAKTPPAPPMTPEQHERNRKIAQALREYGSQRHNFNAPQPQLKKVEDTNDNQDHPDQRDRRPE